MYSEIDNEELNNISGGCGWCYAGATLAVAGGFLCGGVPGAVVAGVGVISVVLN